MGGLRPMAIAFGIAGLFASAFLITGSFNITVQERTRELALLRAIGADRKQVMRLVLQEAIFLGAVGGAVGIALGSATASALVKAASQSLGVQEHPVVLSWLPLLAEWVSGAVLAAIAAWKPAHAASSVAPLAAMRPDLQRETSAERKGGIGGLVMMVLGSALVALGSLLEDGTGLRALTGALGGLTIAAGLIFALPRILPVVVTALAWPLRRLFPSEGLLAGRSVLRHRKRSALTAATLVLGVMLATTVSTVLGEVSANSETWVRSQFAGEAQIEIRGEGDLGEELPTLIAQIPGIREVAVRYSGLYGYLKDFDFSRADQEWLANQAKRATDSTHDPKRYLQLTAVHPVAMSHVYDFGRIQGHLDGGGLLISEQQAEDRGIQLGDTLTLDVQPDQPAVFHGRVAAGPTPYEVTAIVEHLPFGPSLLADVRLFPGAPATMLFFSYDSALRDSAKAAVQTLLRDPRWSGATFRDLHDALEEQRQALHQRWAILGAVVGVVMVIGTFGLVNTVVTGLHQRRRELATLRAVGATPIQITRQVILEAVLLGLAGSLLGLLAGAAFLWGVAIALGTPPTMHGPAGLYLACLATGPGVAALAGVIPAIRISRGPVAHRLQAE